MSTTTQAIEIIDELVKAKIPKRTATKLIDYADKQKGDAAGLKQDVEAVKTELKSDINWLKWVVGLLSAFIIGLGSLMIYLHSDTKVEMKELRTELKTEMKELKTEVKELKTEFKTEMKELKKLLQK